MVERREPCQAERPDTSYERVADGETVALCISGGGFRATMSGLGVARYLADVGLLANVRLVSSVSGGSIANATLARRWADLRAGGFTGSAVDELVIGPVRRAIEKDSLKKHLVRNIWRLGLGMNRTELLARAFEKRFDLGVEMHELDEQVRWVVNGANIATGTRFTFEQATVGDYVNGYLPMSKAKVRLSIATATSCAVPGAFAGMKFDKLELPCRHKHDKSVLVVDGGAYDNTGLEVVDYSNDDSDREKYADLFTVVAAVGGIMPVGARGGLPIVKDLMRSQSSLYRQSRALRTRDMVRRFSDGERKGILMTLDSRVDGVVAGSPAERFAATYPRRDEHAGKQLAQVATSFDQYSPQLSSALLYHSWWLTGMLMHHYHPELAPLPEGTDPPG